MRDAVAALRSAGLPARVIVGGAPVTAEYAREIGADGYAADAGSAAEVALSVLGAA
jgi:5-methyltetrahydrofolate--homocysteine methyltransferase